MEKPILSNKDQSPTQDIIYSQIGKNKILWDSLLNYIRSNYPDFMEEWRYYNDGKSWLLKVTRKSKTIFWISLIDHSFRTTFYFTDRAKQTIMNSLISDELKKQFKGGKRFNKIRGITITFTQKKDVEYAKELIKIKLDVK